jgi:hypothetical protein
MNTISEFNKAIKAYRQVEGFKIEGMDKMIRKVYIKDVMIASLMKGTRICICRYNSKFFKG